MLSMCRRAHNVRKDLNSRLANSARFHGCKDIPIVQVSAMSCDTNKNFRLDYEMTDPGLYYCHDNALLP